MGQTRAKAWEFQLERWHAAYRRGGDALLFRCHPEVKVVEGRIRFTAKGPPDFAGLVITGLASRPVVFDAKLVTTGTKLYWSKVPKHQVADLKRASMLGACAFLAVRFYGVGDFIAPIGMLGESDTNPAPMTPDNCIPMGADGWLPVVRSAPLHGWW